MEFDFPSREAMVEDQVVGTSYDAYCEHVPLEDVQWAPGNLRGPLIPMQVLVRSKRDGQFVLDQTFNTLCMYALGGQKFNQMRRIGYVQLAIGEYTFGIRNLKAHTGLAGVIRVRKSKP